MIQRGYKAGWGFLLSLILAGSYGCASTIPAAIETAPPGNPDIALVRAEPKCCLGQSVRWGGIILNTENLASTTRITILSMPLSKSGKPIISDKGQGRFVAEFKRFLEPALFPQNKRITVVGTLRDSESSRIGDYLYTYPVVEVIHHYRWPEELPEPEYYDPWYPWYPWYLYPYPYPYPLSHPYHHVH